MKAELSKWGKTIEVTWANQTAYKFDFFLQAIGPALVFFLIQYNLWKSIYAIDGVTQLQGYTLSGMIQYQAWVLIVSFLSHGHNARALSEDIRLGRISSYLLYPFEFWKFHCAAFLGIQGVHAFVALITIVAIALAGLVALPSFATLMCGICCAFLVGVLWFVIQFILGIVAFWLEETWVLRVIFKICAQFLAGGVVPLELFPREIRELLFYTPFPYLTYVPVKIFMGTYTGNIAVAVVTIVLWTALFGVFAAWVWRRGIRLYSAAGM